MAQFRFPVVIEANDQQEAKKKLQSAIVLMKSACTKLTTDEFAEMVSKIEKDPGKIVMAKNFL